MHSGDRASIEEVLILFSCIAKGLNAFGHLQGEKTSFLTEGVKFVKDSVRSILLFTVNLYIDR